MRKKFVSLILICGLALTACSNLDKEDTTLAETTSAAPEAATQTEASKTAKESDTETEDTPLEFTGIDISDEALENFSFIGDSNYYNQHEFCSSEDMVYFSNVNNGWKVYSYDGENAKLILDKKVHYLYYFDNSLYFLSDRKTNDKPANGGILYKYDIESEEVTKLTDEDVFFPRADETGIYYSKKYEDKFYIYRFDEQTGEDERLYEGSAYCRIGDYEISREVTGKKGEDEVYDYYLLKGNEKTCFLSGTTIYLDFIQDGIFYYKDWNYKVHTIDLRTGEKNTLPMKDCFTVLDGEIYYFDDLFSGVNLYRWNKGEPERVITIGLDLTYTGYRGNYEDHDINGYNIYCSKDIINDGKSLYIYVYPPNGDYFETHLGKVEPLNDGSGDYVLTMIY